jgi:arabinofuranosyltransferase
MRHERTSPWWWALPAGALLLFALQAWDYMNFGVDDVFITLRYAGNIAHGAGAVYNRGEFVEGYSNWLWMQMLAFASRVSMSFVHDTWTLLWTAKAGSLLFGLGSVLFAALLARDLHSGERQRGVATAMSAALLAASGPFAAWSMGGMETTLNAFLFTLAAWLGLRLARTDRPVAVLPGAVALGLALALAALTRPEPVLHAIALIAGLWALLPSRRRIPALVAAGLTFTVLYAAFLGWRWSMYHDLVPNTFYAKTGGGPVSLLYGLKYTAGALGLAGGLALLPLGAAFLRPVAARRAALYVSLPIVCSLAFSVYSGGDWMPGGRFLVPVLPLIAALGASGLATVLDRLRDAPQGHALKPSVLVPALLLCLVLSAAMQRDLLRGQLPEMPSGFKEHSGHAVGSKERAGLWLRAHLPADATFASGEAGVIGWLNPGMRLIDCNGLMDRAIARRRRLGQPFDAGLVLSHRPDALVLLDAPVDAFSLRLTGATYQLALPADPRFASGYAQAARFDDIIIYTRRAVPRTK